MKLWMRAVCAVIMISGGTIGAKDSAQKKGSTRLHDFDSTQEPSKSEWALSPKQRARLEAFLKTPIGSLEDVSISRLITDLGVLDRAGKRLRKYETGIIQELDQREGQDYKFSILSLWKKHNSLKGDDAEKEKCAIQSEIGQLCAFCGIMCTEECTPSEQDFDLDILDIKDEEEDEEE